MTQRLRRLAVLAASFAIFSSHAETGKQSVEPAQVNDPAIAGGSEMAKILRAQILLDRAKFSPGEIDGNPGANLSRALSGFQESRGLPISGQLDDPTWQALNADTAPAVAPYRITDTDVAGSFVDVPRDLQAQSKLESLGYRNAEEALGEQFHIRPAVLKLLNPAATFKSGEEIQVPNVLPGASDGVQAAKIIVMKRGIVRAVDEAGKILAQYPASSGSGHDPLPIGEWKINGVFKDPKFHYNPALFWDADPSHTKATIAAGPNNPVGSVWIDLSKEHYGIHGSPEPSKVGHTQSHGCIRLTNWDAIELAAMVGPGTPALLTE